MNVINCSTTEDFVKFIQEKDVAIVLLSKRPCGFCEKVEPIFTELSRECEYPCLKMVIYTTSPAEVKKIPFDFGMRMAPALAIFRNGKLLNYTIEFIDQKQMMGFVIATLKLLTN
ncbi:MAG: hypothetical protein LBD63_01240 [Mycoplasmataceae bacterium]|jgi:thiol-disulfide isomerase/thioredoxin|nr:hypothetical protein [Mycoplasmataceae bacterium]